jgi:diacylglycerol kinase
MRSIQSAWIFNLALRLAAVVCLGVLAVGLVLDVEPLTALMRSGVAFIVFLMLGWAVAAIWDVASPEMSESAGNVQNQAVIDEADNQGLVPPVPDEVPASA